MSITQDELEKKLDKERLRLYKWFLGDIAQISQVMSKEMGIDKFKEIFLKMRHKNVTDWTSGVAQIDIKEGRKNNIKGLIRLIWDPLEEEGFKYSYEKKDDGSYQFKVTNCPIANIAKESGIEEWIFLYLCMSDYPITEGYNPNIGFKRSKTIMQGDDYCDHYYFWKEKKKRI